MYSVQIVQKQSYIYHFWSQVLYMVSLRAKGLAKKAGREEEGSRGGTKGDKTSQEVRLLSRSLIVNHYSSM